MTLQIEGRDEPIEVEIGQPVAFAAADGSMIPVESSLTDVADMIDWAVVNLPKMVSTLQSLGPIASMFLPSPFNKLTDPKVIGTLVFLIQWLPALQGISQELRKVE